MQAVMVLCEKFAFRLVRALPAWLIVVLCLASGTLAVMEEVQAGAVVNESKAQPAESEYKQVTAIVIAILTPVVGAVVGGIVSRTGTTGKIKEIEYLLKRLELIEKLHTAKQIRETSEESKELDWLVLETELEHIIQYMKQTSDVRAREEVRTDYVKQKRVTRIFILPKPLTINGWIATIIYYLYGFSGVAYLLLYFWPYSDPEFVKIAPLTIMGSLLLAVLARLWALHSFNKALQDKK